MGFECNTSNQYEGWKNWLPEKFGQFSRSDAQYFSKELHRSCCAQIAGKRILEIGFGNGSFLGWASSKGAECAGVEVIENLVDLAREYDFEAHLSLDKEIDQIFGPETIDIIVAFDVFEHLDIRELKTMLIDCNVVLRQEGLLVARVPSGDSPFSRAIQYGDTTHRSILGSSAIRQIAMELQYDVISIREPVFPVTGLGLIQGIRRSLVYILRFTLNKFISNVVMGKSDAVLSPNLVFVLRKI